MKIAGLVVFVGTSFFSLAACRKSDCQCTSPASLTITAPAGLIADVRLGGDACAGLFPSCPESTASDYPAGCARTLVFARRGGSCNVEIDLASGAVVTRTVQLAEHPDACCDPVTAANAGEGEIVVSADDAGDDGG